jgi:predicted metal-dependent hydrolase
MTVHSFEERLEDAANHLQGLEEKVWQGLAASMHWLLHMAGKWRVGLLTLAIRLRHWD